MAIRQNEILQFWKCFTVSCQSTFKIPPAHLKQRKVGRPLAKALVNLNRAVLIQFQPTLVTDKRVYDLKNT